MNECSVTGNMSVPVWCHPAPFSPVMTGVLGTLSALVSLITLGGNVLVVIAFFVERSLRTATNYFIASLAVTDLLIGAFSMNLFTLYLLLGYWPLGQLFCDLWLSLDYTACLVSQYTVLLITVDRFCSVTIPARYRNWRSERKIRVMIGLIWVLSSILFFSIIMGWPFFTGRGSANRLRKEWECFAEFTKFPIFSLILTISYYWVTLVVMCSLYAGIYRVALQLQRKSEEKHRRMKTIVHMATRDMTRMARGFEMKGTTTITSTATNAAATAADRQERRESSEQAPMLEEGQGGRENGNSGSGAADLPRVTQEERSSSPMLPSDSDNACENKEVKPGPDLVDADSAKSLLPAVPSPKPAERPSSFDSPRVIIADDLPSTVVAVALARSPSDRRMATTPLPPQKDESPGWRSRKSNSSSSEGFEGEPRRRSRTRFSNKGAKWQRGLGRFRSTRGSDGGSAGSGRKSRTENRARKALRTITLILGAFLICWTPFHILSLIDSFCTQENAESCINGHLFNIAYWMCYLNSPINPFCYALANNQFKKTFIRILNFNFLRT